VPSTEARVSAIAQLIAEGCTPRIILSHDICASTCFKVEAAGSATSSRIIPLILDAGADEEALQTILVDNPAQAAGPERVKTGIAVAMERSVRNASCAQTPPMGWNSWSGFGKISTRISSAKWLLR
jgi:hypothetical protein